MSDYTALERLPDDELMRQAGQGNSAAFQQLCVRLLPSLLRYARNQCGLSNVPLDLADDFCHDAIINAVGYITKRPPRKVSVAWMKKIVANLICDWRRRQNRVVHLDDEAFDSIPAVEPIERQEREEILKFFQWIRDTERDVLELVLLEELTFTEVSDRLKISYAAANKAYHRGLGNLRDLIREHGELVPSWLVE